MVQFYPTIINFLQLAELALADEYNVSTAPDGLEGMNKVKKDLPDIILLDVVMPHISGLEMLRMLLTEEETRDIPVLILTASHFDPSTEQIFKQEINVKGFLQKPCPVDMLKAAITAAVKK